MIGLAFLVIILIYIICFLFKCTLWALHASNIIANIPGPKPWPLLGSAPSFARIKSLEDMYTTFLEEFQKHSDPIERIMKVWMGPKLMIFLGNPKHIEIVLSSHDALEKDPLYKYIGLTANGLFVRNGDDWKELRKPLNRLLTKKMIDSNIEMFHERALIFCKILKKYVASGEYFNIRRYTTNYSVDTLSASNFGYQLNEQECSKYNLHENLDKGLEITLKLMIRIPYNLNITFAKFSSQGRILRKIGSIFWNLSTEILQGRIANKKLLGEDVSERPAFYSDVLIQKSSKDNLSEEDTGRLVTDFLIAGFDTSAVTIAYALFLLAMYPEHQEAVYQEQIDILGENVEVIPTSEQLSKMCYLTRVLKEVMRLYCPIAILRRPSKDIDLGEYKVPKGCTAYIMFYSLHRDPNFWSHPNDFYPDHFLPEEVAARPKGAYMPFSWGPRSCPGGLYALVTSKTLLSVAIRKYKFETNVKFEELIYKYSLLLEPSKGHIVKVLDRNMVA